MAYFMVSSAKLRAYAEELSGLNQSFLKAMEELSSGEAALKSMWEGEANETFHAAFLSDYGKMEAFSEVILQYIQALQMIAAKYEEAEARNVNTAANRTYH